MHHSGSPALTGGFRLSTGQQCGQGGFTLLEMLVVVVVLGLLVVGLGHGVRTGVALWNAQQQRVAQTAELDASARILRTLLSGIMASPNGAAGGAAAADNAFKGDAERLSFVGDLPTGLGTTRRADIVLALRNGNLLLTWTPHLHEIPLGPPAPPTDTQLVAGVERLDIAYWGGAPDQPAAWQTRWDGPAPPGLVRIRLVFGKGDRRRWPDLIAAPIL